MKTTVKYLAGLMLAVLCSAAAVNAQNVRPEHKELIKKMQAEEAAKLKKAEEERKIENPTGDDATDQDVHSKVGGDEKYIMLPIPGSGKIVLKYMFLNGSASDPGGLEGLTYLTASLMAEGGTKKMTSTQVKDFLYPMAARTSASIDKEAVVFTFEFHKDHAEKVYPVISSLVYEPRFGQDDFERLKSNQQNYVDEVIKASSDEHYSKMALEERLFRNTTYQHLKQGYSQSIRSLTLEEVKAHYKGFFTQNNLIIGIAGDYTGGFAKTVENDKAKLPNEYPPKPDFVHPEMPEGLQIEIIAKEGALGAAIYTGTPLQATRAEDDFAALMIANSWLGEHRKSYSRLYQKIRQQRSMNYGDYSYIEWYEKGGQNMLPLPGVPRSLNYFSIWIRPVQTAAGLNKQIADQPAGMPADKDAEQDAGNDVEAGPESQSREIEYGHAYFALRMAIREMDKLINEGMSAEDFELTRQFLTSYMKLYVQTPEKQLGFLMDSRYYGRKDYLAEMENLFEGLNLEDVNNAMRQYWYTQRMHVAIVTDAAEAEALAESMRGGEPSPMIYSPALREVLSKEILAEDEEVSAYPLEIVNVQVTPSELFFKEPLD